MEWFFNEVTKIKKAGNDEPLRDDSRFEIIGQASLYLMNTTLNDSGEYKVDVTANDILKVTPLNFKVIIQVQPVASTTCVSSVNITQGQNFSCICSGEKGSPSPTASWLKDIKLIKVGNVKTILDLSDISKSDTGTYICRAQSGTLTDERRVDITVFDEPVVNVACNTSVSIKEGKDFSCKCSGNDGSPPPSVMWLKDNNELTTVNNILKLRNISKLNNGTYVCRVQSGNLFAEKRVGVTVLCKPTMISFTSNATKDIAKLGGNVKLTCVTIGGYPKPTYRIRFNEKTVSSTGVLIIENADSDDTGTYTCFSSNPAGSIQKRLVLIVTESGGGTLPPCTTPGKNTNDSTEKSICDKKCGGTEWYIVVITLVCGIGIGIIFSFTVMWLCRQRKENRDPKPSETRGSPETHDNPSVYQELDLQRMNKEDNYQSLRKTSGPVNRQEPTGEVESSYQELDKVRGSNDDNNYQSLNRV